MPRLPGRYLGLTAVLLLSTGWAAAQTLPGLWGSPLYRVQLSVAGSSVTGTFTSLADPQAPAGSLTGQLRPDGLGFTATWTAPVGPDTAKFSTYLRFAAQGSLLTGYRWSEETQPAAFTLHRAVNGQVPLVVGPADVSDGGLDVPKPPVDPIPEYVLKAPASSFPGPASYPTAAGGFELEFRYDKPGVILDTVGLNSAAVGDFQLGQREDGAPVWQIYNRGVAGAHRQSSGWHVLVWPRKVTPGSWHRLVVSWGRGGMALAVDGQPPLVDPAVLSLSGKTVFIGDFPGDDNWGTQYNIHPAMVGAVRAVKVIPALER